MRPGDANEVVEAWKLVMKLTHEPVAMVLSRQNCATIDRSKYAPASGVAKGAYVLCGDPNVMPELILIGTGSEVQMCVEAYEKLTSQGVNARVVSMPSWELFEHQSDEYKEAVFPASVQNRISIEQASTFGWSQYVRNPLGRIGMKTFGASAPLKELQKKFGFTPEAIIGVAHEMLAKRVARGA
jgi:transketolase